MNFNFDWEHRKQETVYNDKGAGQSKVHRDWTLIPWNAMAVVEQVLSKGAEHYGRENWKGIPVPEHVQHLIEHAIASYQCSDDTLLEIEHLSHTVCRALFALELLVEEVQNAKSREMGDVVNARWMSLSSDIHTLPTSSYGNAGRNVQRNNEPKKGVSE